MEEQLPNQSLPTSPQSAVAVSYGSSTTSTPPSQPVFYSLSPDESKPLSAPWYRRRQMMVIIVTMLLLTLSVGIVTVYALNWFSQRRAIQQQAAKQTQDMVSARASSCDQALDPEGCRNGAGMQVANITGAISACNGLADFALDSCITLAARTSASVSACDALSGQAKIDCSDSALNAQALAEVDANICAKIMDSALASGCASHVTEIAVAAGDCVGAHVDLALCDERARLREAIAAGLEGGCDQFSAEDLKIDCVNGIHSVDDDSDGLTVFDEVNTHHTDPKNPDTDGDGYNDGDEVASGHDPLKK